MSTGNSSKLKKGSRVSGVNFQPSRSALILDSLKRADVLARIGMCVVAALAMWLLTMGWQPPFAYREGDVPSRAIPARVAFSTVDEEETARQRQLARKQVVTIYRTQSDYSKQLRGQLLGKIRQVKLAESLDQLVADDPRVWNDFMHGVPVGAEQKIPAERFDEFRSYFVTDEELEEVMNDVTIAMKQIDEFGILEQLQHDYTEDGGDQDTIRVGTADSPSTKEVAVKNVLIETVTSDLEKSLQKTLKHPVLAMHIAAWFKVKGRLQETLSFDREATDKAAELAASAVEDVMTPYSVNTILVDAGTKLKSDSIALLREEYKASNKKMSISRKLGHSIANFGMYAAVFLLCGCYGVFRRNKTLTNTESLLRILCLSVATVGLCWFASGDFPQTVTIPLLLFSMTIVIAYEQELALLLSTVMALIVVVTLGFGLQEFIIYVAAMATAVLCLRNVRNRTKLIYVGLASAAVTGVTAVGASTLLMDSPWGLNVWVTSLWYSFFAVVAGLLMTGLLPFIESLFDIQTDLSLLELGDVSHPLLQELVRRAPGTYNHTINVASMAEAAAESIDANGLLVRVGAYFHDIGKMLKPGYFIENQGDGNNRHETLLPAMSTLVIIAHVKDGADLARQHNLPNALIDFIMQHHGTTLVEYFYNRAHEQSESDPDSSEVDEHSYRYPGPKPQTKEAAVLMLADTVESAGRSLTDPTPSRIEGLVRELAMKKLLDGQFEECGLTLSELKKIEMSLIKSMSAVYHARIKYPDQQSA